MLNVGQGVRDQMASQSDHPIADSTFVTNSDGTVVERGLGLKGAYVASNASGHWEAAGPLPVA